MPKRPTLLLTLVLSLSLALPDAAARAQSPPVPLPRPQTAPRPEPSDVPVPDEKPIPPKSTAPRQPRAEPQKPPPPQETSAPAHVIGPLAPPTGAETRPAPVPDMPPIEPEDRAEHAQCLKDLTALSTVFEASAAIDDGSGCGISRPITVRDILPGIALAPAATLRCEAARSLARFTREMIVPAARAALGEKGRLKAIHHASAYVCRNRNSAETGEISEHARGNAIDISALEFEGGMVPMAIVAADDGTLIAAFRRSLNAAACLFFTTVLSPGSDAAHQDHLHLDVIERKDDFHFCR